MSDIERHELVFDKLEHETESAYLIHFDEDDKNTHLWIPKSRCDILVLPHDDKMGEMELEDWLIDENELDGYMS